MTQSTRIPGKPSRRKFLAGAGAAGAAMAVGLPAPAILAQTKAPLRLGILNTFTGVLNYLGTHNVNGMSTYFDRIGWTIAGRKIELLKEDDQANPQVGLQKAKKFLESDKVDILCGPQGSNVAMAMLNYVKQAKAFIVVSGAGVDAITWDRNPYLFRTSISAWQLSNPMGKWMYDNIAKEVVMLGTDFAGGRDVLRTFGDSFKAAGGKILKEVYVPFGTNDFSAYLTDLRAINPPASFNWFGGTDAVRFVQQYAEQGLKEKIRLTGFAALIDSSTLEAQGKAALGCITSTIYSDTLDNAENKRFVAEYREKYKEYPTIYSDYGFVTACVLDEALKATDGDTSDKDKLSEAMAKVAFAAPRGPFRFDPVTHNPIQNVYMCEVQEIDGRIANKDIAAIKDVKDPGKKEG